MTNLPRRFSVLLFDFRGHSHILLATLRALRSHGDVRVHVLSDRRLEPARFSRRRTSFNAVPSEGGDPVRLEALDRLTRKKGIDVLLPCCDEAVRFAAHHIAELKEMAALPPTPSPETLQAARDKWRLTSLLASEGIPVPGTRLVTAGESASDVLRTMRLPLIVKPRIGAGGWGIRRADTTEALEAILREGDAESGGRIVQQFVPGQDYGCSLLSERGNILAHTEQRWIVPAGAPFAAAAGNSYEPVDELFGIVSSVARLLCWSGVANIDARYDSSEGRFKIFEWNPRFWRSILGSAHAGVNFPYLASLTALGIAVEPPVPTRCRYVHENRLALAHVLRRLQPPNGERVRLRETVLPLVLRDPLADAALLLPGHG